MFPTGITAAPHTHVAFVFVFVLPIFPLHTPATWHLPHTPFIQLPLFPMHSPSSIILPRSTAKTQSQLQFIIIQKESACRFTCARFTWRNENSAIGWGWSHEAHQIGKVESGRTNTFARREFAALRQEIYPRRSLDSRCAKKRRASRRTQCALRLRLHPSTDEANDSWCSENKQSEMHSLLLRDSTSPKNRQVWDVEKNTVWERVHSSHVPRWMLCKVPAWRSNRLWWHEWVRDLFF